MPAPRGPKKVPAPSLEPKPESRRRPKARTPTGRENQLAALAYDLAEKQLIDGTASAPVISHFLKIGSTREQIELQKLKQDTILVEAKVKDLANVEDLKRMYNEAMDAMRGYGGGDPVSDGTSDIY